MKPINVGTILKYVTPASTQACNFIPGVWETGTNKSFVRKDQQTSDIAKQLLVAVRMLT